jgi:hypothetical protein
MHLINDLLKDTSDTTVIISKPGYKRKIPSAAI